MENHCTLHCNRFIADADFSPVPPKKERRMDATRTATIDRNWQQMNAGDKIVWFGKLFVALVTFGFVYPRITDPHLRD